MRLRRPITSWAARPLRPSWKGFFPAWPIPVIGLDHLAFIVAVGVAVGVAGLNLVIPALFIVGLRGRRGAARARRCVAGRRNAGCTLGPRRRRDDCLGPFHRHAWVWTALFVAAGLIHGYAFGESIYGAEASPLVAYLVGLIVVQSVLATVVALIARRSGAAAVEPRLAGAAIAGIGLAILAGQLLPA